MLLWGTLVVSSIDNVLKPLIISHGSNLPFVLVLLGILGGVVAFGFIGVFLGPVLLALGLALLKEWAVLADDARATAAGRAAGTTRATLIRAPGRRPSAGACASARCAKRRQRGHHLREHLRDWRRSPGRRAGNRLRRRDRR